MARTVRLTDKEMEVIRACLSFATCGEIDGGPLMGDSNRVDGADTKRNLAAVDRVWRKLS